MEAIANNKDLILYTSIPVTVVILIFSVVYTARNILKIWNAGKPTPVEPAQDTDSEEENSLPDEGKGAH